MNAPERLLWCTDTHLDQLPARGGDAQAWGRSMRLEHPQIEGMLITGDVSEAPRLERDLEELALGFDRPIYFVLGNHDYYFSSFARVEESLQQGTHLQWLRRRPLVHRDWALVGNSGWYDGRYGNAEHTAVQVKDWQVIAELAPYQEHREQLLVVLREKADELARELGSQIEEVLQKNVRRIFIATHVPPYQQAAWYQGKTADDHWAPWFSSGATGRLVDEISTRHLDREFVVLCGHTHSPGTYRPRANVRVFTGAADYGNPHAAGMVHLGRGDVSLAEPVLHNR